MTTTEKPASTTSTSQSVVSGVGYRVRSVAGREPTLLAQFLGEKSFTVELGDSDHLVRGCGSPLDGCVRFHEKDDGAGRDVRVWHVTAADGGFSAEHIAAF